MRASDFEERKLSKGEEKEKERIVKGMKKAKGDFKDRYGKDAEAVMYATATKMAKGESKEQKKNCGCNQDPCITYGKQVQEYVFTRRDFLDNEAENLHSENAVELAKKFGTPKEIKQMDDILTRHMKRGHITPEDMEVRDALVRKYYGMLEGKVIEDTEHDEVKVILNKHGIRRLDDIEYGSKAYEELFGYYMDSGEMPYGVMKARDGDPEEWIIDRIGDLGLIEGKKEDDYKAKKKALQDIQADPNTAKDPELKKELIRRKAELEKLKEEMDWKLNESLVEGFEKEVMLVMKDNGIEGFFNKGTLYIDGDNETVEKAKDLLHMNFRYTDDVEVKQEKEYYNESKQKPYVSMYRDGNDGKMVYDVLDKNGDSVYKTNDKTSAMAYLKKNYKDLSEDDSGLQGSVTPQQISKEFPGVADKNNLVQALLKMKRGDKNYSRNQMIAAADAFKELLSKDPMETQKLMMMLKRIKAKEEVASDINDKWTEYQK